jgi:hypothetical protein
MIGARRVLSYMETRSRLGHRGIILGLAVVAIASAFFLPLVALRLSPGVWYPYTDAPGGYGSVTYKYLGYGAVFWAPNHYWLYFGSSVVQLTNSSASTVTVNSVDQNGTTIFGYYTILSDPGGKIVDTGYTKVSFSTTAGQQYTLQMEGYGRCTFSHWLNGETSSELVVLAESGDESLTAVFNC